MTPADFIRSHGLLVDRPIEDGRWHRVPTVDHPRSTNGAYLVEGDKAVCQNWATMPRPEVWHPLRGAREIPEHEREQRRRAHRERAATQEQAYQRSALRAGKLIDTARPGHHGYLMFKGFGQQAQGLCLPDGKLLVPMRNWRSNEVQGAQLIWWEQEPRRYEKKFLPGMRARGAVFRLGRASDMGTILCEGYATGLSIKAALDRLRWSAPVLVCFSAGNLTLVAGQLGGRCMAFADNDPLEADPEKARANPGCAGERACIDAGIPYVMSERVGEDANDLHVRAGLAAVCAKLTELRRLDRSP